MSPISTLADCGYRRLGPLPTNGPGLTASEIVEVIKRCDQYESASEWVRRRGRKKGVPIVWPYEVVTVFDRTTALTNDYLQFTEDYFASIFANTDLPRLWTENETILSLVEEAASELDRWRGMYRLIQSLHYAGRQRLRPLLRDRVAPCFFGLYPEGRVAAVRYTDTNDNAASMLRVLYAAAQTSLAQVKQSSQGIRTLQCWHMNSAINLGQTLLELFNYLFYPFIAGSRGGPPGLDFLFLFEPAEQFAIVPYPRNWLAPACTAASFGREEVGLMAVLQDYKGPAAMRAAHQRYQFAKGYTVGERLDLFRWYIDRVNRLLYQMADVANFTEGLDPEAAIDPVFGFEHHMTVDRLARKTLLSMSLEDVGTARFMVFEVAELYDTLSERFRRSGSTEFFKDLLHPVEGPAILRDRLALLPAPFGHDLPALADQLYQKIQEAVIGSVWLRSKVTDSHVMVRDKALAAERPMPHADFVAELMRCYRNGHHGYFTAGDPQG
jgi:hypothetical protein